MGPMPIGTGDFLFTIEQTKYNQNKSYTIFNKKTNLPLAFAKIF